MFRIIPESARWLITKKQYQQADVILQRAARFNKVHLPSNWYQMLDSEVSLLYVFVCCWLYSYLEIHVSFRKNLQHTVMRTYLGLQKFADTF